MHQRARGCVVGAASVVSWPGPRSCRRSDGRIVGAPLHLAWSYRDLAGRVARHPSWPVLLQLVTIHSVYYDTKFPATNYSLSRYNIRIVTHSHTTAKSSFVTIRSLVLRYDSSSATIPSQVTIHQSVLRYTLPQSSSPCCHDTMPCITTQFSPSH